MNILHICAGWQPWNGAANIARLIANEQKAGGDEVSFATWASVRQLCTADEVWIHCGWLPCLWWAAVVCFLTQRKQRGKGAEKVLKWMPEACYDPVRLRYHGWKKRLVGPIERFCLRRAKVLVATCEAEKGWIQAYLGTKCPPVEVTDVRRPFDLSRAERVERVDSSGKIFNAEKQRGGEAERGRVDFGGVEGRPLHLLYLGRRHPLKGVEYLEEAVSQLNSNHVNPVNPVENTSTCSTRPKIELHAVSQVGKKVRPTFPLELKIVSSAFGDEKENIWDWCDVLVLPTLSDNFGLVIAEALERGKRVITTDGAPAWGPGRCENVKVLPMSNANSQLDMEILECRNGRMLYLKGYRDGTAEERVAMLKAAIKACTEKRTDVRLYKYYMAGLTAMDRKWYN